MKSIGLFGDSFAGLDHTPAKKYHWSSLLASHLGYDLTNYGRPGTSVYYSYKNFIQNYHKHDLNFFLITEPGRYIKSVNTVDNKPIYVPGIPSLEYCKTIMRPSDADALRGWFLSSDDDFNNDMTALMLDKVRELDNNCIMIKCFDRSTVGNCTDVMPVDLYHLQRVQMKYFEEDVDLEMFSINDENHDIISGHLLPEINDLIFKIILKKMETGVWDCSLPSSIAYKYSLDEAWTKRK